MVRSIGLSNSVSERVAKFLLASATDGQVTKGVIRTKLALTHEDLAQLMGTSRETITRTLAEFKKNEIVELKGSTLIIHNKPALELLVAGLRPRSRIYVAVTCLMHSSTSSTSAQSPLVNATFQRQCSRAIVQPLRYPLCPIGYAPVLSRYG